MNNILTKLKDKDKDEYILKVSISRRIFPDANASHTEIGEKLWSNELIYKFNEIKKDINIEDQIYIPLKEISEKIQSLIKTSDKNFISLINENNETIFINIVLLTTDEMKNGKIYLSFPQSNSSLEEEELKVIKSGDIFFIEKKVTIEKVQKLNELYICFVPNSLL